MAIVRQFVRISLNTKTLRKNTKRLMVCMCDVCCERFEREVAQLHGEFTFCSRECKKKADSTLLADKRARTNQERYGVAFSAQIPGASDAMIRTRLENTGAKGPSDKLSSSYAKKVATTLKRHGVIHPFVSEAVIAKRAQTFMTRYGVPHANPSKYMSHEQLVEAEQKGYHVQHTHHSRVSKPERELRIWLEARYGTENIETNVLLNNRLIDFRIRCLDTYVELDGVFWHGLDRPIQDNLNPAAVRRYGQDHEMDLYVASSGLTLVRVTDLEWNRCRKLNDFELLVSRLEGQKIGDLQRA